MATRDLLEEVALLMNMGSQTSVSSQRSPLTLNNDVRHPRPSPSTRPVAIPPPSPPYPFLQSGTEVPFPRNAVRGYNGLVIPPTAFPGIPVQQTSMQCLPRADGVYSRPPIPPITPHPNPPPQMMMAAVPVITNKNGNCFEQMSYYVVPTHLMNGFSPQVSGRRRKKARFNAPNPIHPSAKASVCHSCGAIDTPEWRSGPDGTRTCVITLQHLTTHRLCNACGLKYAKSVKRAKEREEAAERKRQKLTLKSKKSEEVNEVKEFEVKDGAKSEP